MRDRRRRGAEGGYNLAAVYSRNTETTNTRTARLRSKLIPAMATPHPSVRP